jgi:hypothetical protein
MIQYGIASPGQRVQESREDFKITSKKSIRCATIYEIGVIFCNRKKYKIDFVLTRRVLLV